MKLPTIDRVSAVRPIGAELTPSSGPKVVPVAPVNAPSAGPSPSVINEISPSTLALAASRAAEAFQRPVSDPLQRGSDAATGEKDFTVKKPAPEKQQIPPPEPVSKQLLDFLHQVWRASGSAVEATLTDIEKQAQSLSPKLDAVPGELAKADITYVPRKVTKNENV